MIPTCLIAGSQGEEISTSLSTSLPHEAGGSNEITPQSPFQKPGDQLLNIFFYLDFYVSMSYPISPRIEKIIHSCRRLTWQLVDKDQTVARSQSPFPHWEGEKNGQKVKLFC